MNCPGDGEGQEAQHAAVHRSQGIGHDLVTKQQWPVRKELDPNQLNSEVCGSERMSSKNLRKLQGNNIFVEGQVSRWNLKQVWD